MSYIDDPCTCGHSRMDHWHNPPEHRWWKFWQEAYWISKECHNGECKYGGGSYYGIVPITVIKCPKFKLDNLKYLEMKAMGEI